MHNRLAQKILIITLAFLLLVPAVMAEDALDWYTMGENSATVGNYAQAIKYYDNAIASSPNYAVAFSGKAHVLNQQGDFSEALHATEVALAIKSDNRALSEKAFALFKLKRYNESVAAYDRLFLVVDNIPDAYFYQGMAYDNLNMKEKAVAAYDRCTNLDGSNLNAWNQKGLALLSLGRYNEALDSFSQCTRITIKNAEVWNNKGVAYGAIGDYNNAVECFNKALGIDPTYSQAEENLDKAYLQKPFFTPIVTAFIPTTKTSETVANPQTLAVTIPGTTATFSPQITEDSLNIPVASKTTYSPLSPFVAIISVLGISILIVLRR
jgi:tetratricopeptide (TPR) repeat protein